VVVHLLLAPWLVEHHQLFGAAIATGCGMLTILVMAVYLTMKPVGMVIPLATALRVIVTALVTILLLTKVTLEGTLPRLLRLLAASFAYFGLLALSRELNAKDWNHLLRVLLRHPK
jgi:hypothetical protein